MHHMVGNSNLNSAKTAKNDEFYTRLTDIEKELRHYRKHFKDKVVFCNCDDPFESNFFKYFVLNFNTLGLKKLIATCFDGSPIVGNQLSLRDIDPTVKKGTPYKAVVTKVYDKTGDGYIDMLDIKELFLSGENELTELEGNGDFRSKECIELLDEADIVVTNPPFSLFREYIALLMEHKKKFVVIGNMTGIKYKEIFPLIQDNQLWTGYKSFGGGMDMLFAPDKFDVSKVKKYDVTDDGWYVINIMGVIWFTNLDIKKRHEDLILVKKYDPELYPKYVNYDAININNVADIPYDYSGAMGVPITFLDKYNPDQFEILGMNWSVLKDAILSDDIRKNHKVARRLNFYLPTPDGKGNNYKRMFDRMVIKNKHPETH